MQTAASPSSLLFKDWREIKRTLNPRDLNSGTLYGNDSSWTQNNSWQSVADLFTSICFSLSVSFPPRRNTRPSFPHKKGLKRKKKKSLTCWPLFWSSFLSCHPLWSFPARTTGAPDLHLNASLPDGRLKWTPDVCVCVCVWTRSIFRPEWSLNQQTEDITEGQSAPRPGGSERDLDWAADRSGRAIKDDK